MLMKLLTVPIFFHLASTFLRRDLNPGRGCGGQGEIRTQYLPLQSVPECLLRTVCSGSGKWPTFDVGAAIAITKLPGISSDFETKTEDLPEILNYAQFYR